MSAQTILAQLRKAGMSVAGALGVMGNMGEESGLEACRVQGDFTSTRIMSRDYASKVDNGLMTEDAFAKDGKGWGLVQFTWPAYKQGLLTFCRRHSISIANETAQNDYLVGLLKTEFKSLWTFLCSTDDVYTAAERFCKEFERPAINNVQARYKYALKLREELQAQATDQIDNGIEKFWPPRTLCFGMSGTDVEAMQSILKAHGYTLSGVAGVFGDSTKSALMKFQKNHRDVDGNLLVVDGICGSKTWGALLKM